VTFRILHGRLYLDLTAVRDALLPGRELRDVAELIAAGGLPWPGTVWTLKHAPRLPLRLARGLLRLDALERDARATLQRLAQELEREPTSGWPTPDLAALLRLPARGSVRSGLVSLPPAVFLARGGAPLLDGWLVRAALRWAGEPWATSALLLSGVHGLVDVECASALWDLAEEGRRAPKVQATLAEAPPRMPRLRRVAKAQRFLDGLAAFLNRFGHRGPAEAELARPRWREDPEPVLAMIGTYMKADPAASPNVAEWRQHWEREAVQDRVRARLRFRPLRRPAFDLLLATAQQAGVAARNAPFELVRLLCPLRAAALELGRRLAQEGRLASADDVYFVRLSELQELPAPDELRARVAERRAQHARDAALDPPRLADDAGHPLEPPLPPADATADAPLRGFRLSPGTARGRVRILCDAAQAGPGEVVVARHSQAGWTALVAVAAAVVLEDAATSSAVASVARELGIPAVAGVAGATTRLRDGEQVEVDGTNGTVARLRPDVLLGLLGLP
jgi:pyruvate,water dikinase